MSVFIQEIIDEVHIIVKRDDAEVMNKYLKGLELQGFDFFINKKTLEIDTNKFADEFNKKIGEEYVKILAKDEYKGHRLKIMLFLFYAACGEPPPSSDVWNYLKLHGFNKYVNFLSADYCEDNIPTLNVIPETTALTQRCLFKDTLFERYVENGQDDDKILDSLSNFTTFIIRKILGFPVEIHPPKNVVQIKTEFFDFMNFHYSPAAIPHVLKERKNKMNINKKFTPQIAGKLAVKYGKYRGVIFEILKDKYCLDSEKDFFEKIQDSLGINVGSPPMDVSQMLQIDALLSSYYNLGTVVIETRTFAMNGFQFRLDNIDRDNADKYVKDHISLVPPGLTTFAQSISERFWFLPPTYKTIVHSSTNDIEIEIQASVSKIKNSEISYTLPFKISYEESTGTHKITAQSESEALLLLLTLDTRLSMALHGLQYFEYKDFYGV